jgi:hypothetical protein
MMPRENSEQTLNIVLAGARVAMAQWIMEAGLLGAPLIIAPRMRDVIQIIPAMLIVNVMQVVLVLSAPIVKPIIPMPVMENAREIAGLPLPVMKEPRAVIGHREALASGATPAVSITTILLNQPTIIFLATLVIMIVMFLAISAVGQEADAHLRDVLQQR